MAVDARFVGAVGGVMSGPIAKVKLLLATPPTVTTTFPVVAVAGTKTTMLVGLQLPAAPADTPPNATVFVPCVTPKFVPIIVTKLPVGPEGGLRFVMFGGGVTAKAIPLLAAPPTVTTTFPVAAPVGTSAVMFVAPQLIGVANVPLNVTVLVPWRRPNPLPMIVTVEPTGPEAGLKLEMFGMTVKGSPLLATPPTVTTTFPVVAPFGTAAEMLVSVQPTNAAVVPLNVAVLLPCDGPKFTPVIVTETPTSPEVGLKEVMLGGGGVTIKLAPLLATPLTVTTTLPLVAPAGTGAVMLAMLQLVGVATVPLKVTVLVPCNAPKFAPLIVTGVPTGPLPRLKLVIVGAAVAVNGTALLTTPPTVTTTLPGVAPPGTKTTRLVALQLVGAANVPLNVTVLVPWDRPNPLPAIVTVEPIGPEVGLKLEIFGMTVKRSPLLAPPPMVTRTFPLVAPVGTGTVMLVALQLVGVPATPLNVTVLVPCEAPKPPPKIVTGVPTVPEFGLIAVIPNGYVVVLAMLD